MINLKGTAFILGGVAVAGWFFTGHLSVNNLPKVDEIKNLATLSEETTASEKSGEINSGFDIRSLNFSEGNLDQNSLALISEGDFVDADENGLDYAGAEEPSESGGGVEEENGVGGNPPDEVGVGQPIVYYGSSFGTSGGAGTVADLTTNTEDEIDENDAGTPEDDSNSGDDNDGAGDNGEEDNAAEDTTSQDTEAPSVPVVSLSSLTNIVQIDLSSTDSNPSSTVFYDLEYAIGNGDEWRPFASSTVSTTLFLTATTLDETYYFQARAKDDVGNLSVWSDFVQIYIAADRPVVINEVAWAGNSSLESSDEWMELYNNTGAEIDLAVENWTLTKQLGSVSSTIGLTGKIGPNSYYLLERTDDTSVSHILADQLYTGALNNFPGNKLILKRNGEIMDEVDCTNGWFAGESDGLEYKSMERIDSIKSGNLANNWQSAPGIRYYEEKDNNIFGSPKASNFSPVLLKGTQEDNLVVLDAKFNPYILKGYTVPIGKKLMIGSGVVIKALNGAYIEVLGELEANGVLDNPVIFTSGLDKQLSGEKNQTQFDVASFGRDFPQAGDWQGFKTAGGKISLNYTNVSYAGQPYSSCNGSCAISRTLDATMSTINLNHAIMAFNGTSTIYSYMSDIVIGNSEFSIGDMAIEHYAGGVLVVTSTKFENYTNLGGTAKTQGIWPELSDLTFANNGFDGISIKDVTLSENASIFAGWKYLFGNFTVSLGSQLKIFAGAQIYLGDNAQIEVVGTMDFVGEETNRIIVQPFTFGGFGNINYTNSTSSIFYTDFVGINYVLSSGFEKAGVVSANGSHLTLNNARFVDFHNGAATYGTALRGYNSEFVINNCEFAMTEKNWSLPDVKGVKMLGGTLDINSSDFVNLKVGIYGEGDPMPTVSGNLTEANFTAVEVNWWPLDLLPSGPT